MAQTKRSGVHPTGRAARTVVRKRLSVRTTGATLAGCGSGLFQFSRARALLASAYSGSLRDHHANRPPTTGGRPGGNFDRTCGNTGNHASK